MTGEQSRQLKMGERVCWNMSTTDLGTVVGADWSEVIKVGRRQYHDRARARELGVK
jgi:hypothetical protein